MAIFDDDTLISSDYAKLGRGHAERLVPMIAKLPERGKADAILVNCGPGSFTGLRVGISAAKALALAWGVPVHGYNCLHLIAAMALAENDSLKNVDVAMHGGHGEFFVQSFDKNGVPISDMASLKPDAALRQLGTFIAGSGSENLADLGDDITALPLWPDARHILQLPQAARALPAEPVYGRAPDAKPVAAQQKIV